MRNNLIEARKTFGLTQQQVADALNINRTTYTGYEAGTINPSFNVMLRIKEFFRVQTDEIFLDDDVSKTHENTA